MGAGQVIEAGLFGPCTPLARDCRQLRSGRPRKACAAFVVLAVLMALAAPAAAQDRLPKVPAPYLREGRVARASVDLQSASRSSSFQLKVDPSWYGLRLRMQEAQADLDLAVLDRQGREVWSSATGRFDEELFLYRLGNPSLEDGTYEVRVTWPHDWRPSFRGLPLDSVSFGLSLEPIRVSPGIPLAAGAELKDTLDPASGMVRCYRIAVPTSAASLRIDAWSPGADIDLFVFPAGDAADPRLAPWGAQSYRPRESLVVPGINLGGRSVEVMVVAEPDSSAQPFSILANFGETLPAALTPLPSFKPLARGTAPAGTVAAGSLYDDAVRATVEIITDQGGGSGCVIAPDGWVVSNLHVVSGGGGQPPDRVSVGFTSDPRLPPDSQFWARVAAIDRERDLALLKIESGFYGQALPAGYRFPSLALRPVDDLGLGEPLAVVGFPSVGGIGSRASVTLTQGQVAGWTQRSFGTLIKSAAAISPGNSGGAAIDREGRLAGIPTLVVADDSGKLGYITPVGALPADWLKQAGLPVRK